MNQTRKKPANSFQRKTLFVIFLSHFITIAVIIAMTAALPRPAEMTALNGIISEIERSSSREKEITGAIIKLSRLAGRSGYELAVQDMIRNHDASMAALSKNASILKTMEKRNYNHTFLIAIIAAVGAQGLFLLIYISWVTGRVSRQVSLMSWQIDDIMAGKKTEPLYMGKNGVLRELYDKFSRLMNIEKIE